MSASADRRTLTRDRLGEIWRWLEAEGYQVVGPTVRDGAIVYDELADPGGLPAGWTDEQNGGHYRLKRRDDNALFGYAVGPQSWKKYLFPPRRKLWEAKMTEGGFRLAAEPAPAEKLAFIGIRACELAALAIQDKVFLEGGQADPYYQARRRDLFLVAVNCTQAGGTCFCASMQTGPRCAPGYDLALTELVEADRHVFVIEPGSPRGEALVAALATKPVTAQEESAAEAGIENARRTMGRQMAAEGVRELLYANLDHPRWKDVATRCLNCANCTLACPTCFCSTVEDTTDLTGQHAERWRRWDSCFNQEFSYVHGGTVRSSGLSRYRQWMTHKLASWQDQFGTSGCVGCGRCITWCPVGIDITEEVRAIRETTEAVP